MSVLVGIAHPTKNIPITSYKIEENMGRKYPKFPPKYF
jgi:hypothetical protein